MNRKFVGGAFVLVVLAISVGPWARASEMPAVQSADQTGWHGLARSLTPTLAIEAPSDGFAFAGAHGAAVAPRDRGMPATAVVGLRGTGHFDGPLGPVDARLLLSLEQPIETAGRPGTRHNLKIEEIDGTRFRLEHALSLRLRGRLNEFVRYETRVRLRSTGIREVSARLKINF